jgi:murein DD-endopeptidase MepM/ murein hydrolase activator NlpD
MRRALLVLLLLPVLPLRAAEPVHVVQQKETLSSIARLYDIPVATLISLNAIDDPNKVKWGTSLRLPAGTRPVEATAAAASAVTTPVSASATPSTPTPATTAPSAARPPVLAKRSATPDWRNYGPLQVDWSAWRTMAGSLVAPGVNSQGQTLYVAVNCGARRLNVTGPAGAWKTWDAPRESFEQELLGAACRDTSLTGG